MKRATLILSLILTLGGCATSESMLEREPTITADAQFSKSEFRDCVFRWADNPAFRLQYHPDGLWVKDMVGGAVALIAQVDGQIALYHHWNAAPSKQHFIFLTNTCNEDALLRPPSNFWKKSPRLNDADV